MENNPELFKCQGKCKQELPRESFYRNRSKPNGLSIFCKECTKIAVENYEKRKKEGKPKGLTCVVCGQKRARYAPEGKCGDCRHREKMRLRYQQNPEYYRLKHLNWRKKRSATKEEIERQEFEIMEKRIRLNRGEMFLITRFNGSMWKSRHEIDPLKICTDEIERLHEIGLIQATEVDNTIEYALTEKGLEFLGIENVNAEIGETNED